MAVSRLSTILFCCYFLVLNLTNANVLNLGELLGSKYDDFRRGRLLGVCEDPHFMLIYVCVCVSSQEGN